MPEQHEVDLRMLVEEQAALNRVAVTVATETAAERVFDVVTEEVARLLGADAANLVRFGPTPDEGVIVGKWSEPGVQIPGAGTIVATEEGSALSKVARTGAPVRQATDDPGVPAELHGRLIELGVTSLVAAPIVVSGHIWGAVVVSLTRDLQFAANAEERLGKFAGLVAVALANTQAREELATLADEQAALSRVAVAAATEQPEQLFNIVTEEVGRLFGGHWASTTRYIEGSDEVELVGRWHRTGNHRVDLGARLPLRGGVLSRVRETGAPARIDYEKEPPAVQTMIRLDRVADGVAAPIVVSGRLWGALSISVAAPDELGAGVETQVAKFTNLVAVTLANAEAREQLTASRARIVQAADAERRRLERNLHDGAQQRLVSLALSLRLAESRLADDPAAAAELLAGASEELALSLAELRELARGIHPAILIDRGLAPAVEALAARATLPVEVNCLVPERLSEAVEAAAFYVVSESLANVAKYASASRARVDLVRDDGLLVVEVADDGVGGADAAKGSGLRGLSDRVEALGGRLRVSSEHGHGTTVRAELPTHGSHLD
jgi:signal transduction histidine kinase